LLECERKTIVWLSLSSPIGDQAARRARNSAAVLEFADRRSSPISVSKIEILSVAYSSLMP